MKLYKIFNPALIAPKIYNKIKRKRELYLNLLLKDLVVKNGPFSGIKYPKLISNHSAIYPKIIGSYETELAESIRGILKNSHKVIYDIGCAEGYYAVGFAINFPDSIVYAIDNDQNALKNCNDMCELNNIKNVIPKNEFKLSELNNYDFENALIFCDSEGYEKQIFELENIKYFNSATVIVEVHDFIFRGLSDIISSNFKNTHTVNVIRSNSDLFKMMNYKYHKPLRLDLFTKYLLYRENRPEKMTWLIIEPIVN